MSNDTLLAITGILNSFSIMVLCVAIIFHARVHR
jgi:hypothetical protein